MLNLIGKISTKRACQNIIQQSISANIKQKNPLKKGLLYIVSPII